MNRHEVKCWPQFFDAILDGRKTFTVRRDDRQPPYVVGDVLELREWEDGVYTGRRVEQEITYIQEGGQHGVEDGYVVLALVPVADLDAALLGPVVVGQEWHESLDRLLNAR